MSEGNRILCLSAYRGCSALLERVMQLHGCNVVACFLADAYYFGHDRFSRRFEKEKDSFPFRDDWGYQDAKQEMLSATASGTSFVRVPACYIRFNTRKEFLSEFDRICFLIRDPHYALPSTAATFPDFTEHETGYQQQLELFFVARDELGQIPVLIDGEDLRAEPEKTIRRFTEALDIPFNPEAFSWPQHMRGPWRKHWDFCKKTLYESVGVNASVEPDPKLLTQRSVMRSMGIAKEVYSELRALQKSDLGAV